MYNCPHSKDQCPHKCFKEEPLKLKHWIERHKTAPKETIKIGRVQTIFLVARATGVSVITCKTFFEANFHHNKKEFYLFEIAELIRDFYKT